MIVKDPKLLILQDHLIIPERTQGEGYQICNYRICKTKTKYMTTQLQH